MPLLSKPKEIQTQHNQTTALVCYFVVLNVFFFAGIPRYKLLIEDLVKNTPSDHPDYTNLTNALDKLAAVAIQVDLAILEQKNRQNLFRIQKKFPDSVQVRRILSPASSPFTDNYTLFFSFLLFCLLLGY